MSLSAKSTYFWRSALQGLRHSPFVHGVAVSTIAIALFTAGLARSASLVLDSLIASIGGDVEMTLYLADATSDGQAEVLARAFASQTQGTARVVAPDAALDRLRKELGGMGQVLNDLPENPLPTSIELQVPPQARQPAALKALAAQLAQNPLVTGVDYGEEAVNRLSAISTALRVGGAVAFAIIVLATIIIVSATLQLAIYARREEIEIQKLVGGTDRFVKAPFLIEGLLQGLLGGAVAVAGLWGFTLWIGPRLTTLFSFLLRPGTQLALIDPRSYLELGLAGCALGLCGSFVAVGRFLRV